MEHGNIALFLQLLLNLKATGSSNILQVDAAKGTRNQIHRIDELVHVLGLDAQRECIHICKGLKQSALALHNRHTGLRANITQSQNSSAVGNHRTQIVTAGQLV